MKRKTTEGDLDSGDVSEAEKKKREESGIAALVLNIVAEEKQKWHDEMRDELRSLESPNRDGKSGFLDTDEDEPTRLNPRVPAAVERQYARMDEETRQWRNPDSDHYMAEYIRGQARRNYGQMMTADEKLAGMFGRAVLAEGAPGTLGAFAAGSGEFLPRPLENVILIARDRVAKMRRWAQSISMTTQTHTVPTAAAMTANMTAESTTSADGNPAIASVQLSVRKGQVTALATNEMLADSAVNLINMWATRGGAALGVLEDDQFFADGDGAGNNISAFLSGTTFTPGTTATEINFAETLEMYYNVAQQYRQNGIWLMSTDMVEAFAQLINATSGQQFYLGMAEKPGPLGDDATAEGTILRRPVFEVPFADGTIWFGDANASYVIGQISGLQSAISDQVKFDLDQVMWKLTQRFDGISIDAIASQVATSIVAVND